MKTTLNVKNMKNTYMNARSDMENVWKTFYMMHCMNYISHEEWVRFYEACKDWTYDPELCWLMDGEGRVIKEFKMA